MPSSFVIIGAGQAGIKAAETLRAKGFDGTITLIGAEHWHPYQRPPLSKAYLKGEMSEDRLLLKAPDWIKGAGIDTHLGKRATRLDPATRTITLDDGTEVPYDKVLIATGTHARWLHLDSADLPGVETLRGIDDTRRIGARLKQAHNVAIIGGGFIGMEVASAVRTMGKTVSVVEAQERILARVVAPEVSAYLETLHSEHGVNLRTAVGVDAIVGNGHVQSVELSDGSAVDADIVLIAAGAEPTIDLAFHAGLDLARGIIVDNACRTSVPHIYAAGDCTVFHSARYGRLIGLESVQNACDQAKAAAASMLGEPVAYDPVPWFWSDQYDTKLQIAGLSAGYDRIETVGSIPEGRFSIRYYAGGTLLAVDSINDPRAHMMARREIAAQPPALAA
ncbi:NAD(P)H-nitrite reductase [Hoeflea phototrophica DFL-43]|jgi:3-phenylpropionate/trans-cinnamate dioxygenase ferredoxin reductase subunit|uniref:NAD(P)H-nitrite reductase n=1 Tax=Hoeflea phototrophica (strain DSM 17068 / NCIMB 14078 / DFL-43) TaxID=411684 RepID=A9DEH3_HOEPD|nr:FAD-dependent oxidoreductase [Hoeflea phototrophica]EDQ31813.1 NAD(P)H-nitrite reductase [Hoeflea phototrophica DFL-43]